MLFKDHFNVKFLEPLKPGKDISYGNVVEGLSGNIYMVTNINPGLHNEVGGVILKSTRKEYAFSPSNYFVFTAIKLLAKDPEEYFKQGV